MKENRTTPIYVLTMVGNSRILCAGKSVGDIVDFLIEKQVLMGHSRAWPIDKFGVEEYYTAPLEAIYGSYWEERVRAMSRSEFNMSFADDFYMTVIPMWCSKVTEDENAQDINPKTETEVTDEQLQIDIE